ncbi:MAG: hypothetical protein Kow006_00550 [Gammaproteobacteria bacterium]
MRRNSLFLALPLLLLPLAAPAAQRTVILAVEKMYCAACPYFVKQTLADLDGVASVEVSYESKQARVVFDDARLSVDDLTAATTELGYPSRPISGDR